MKHLLMLALLPCLLVAQNLEGTWQGTVTPPNQNNELRVVFKITKNGATHQGVLYNIDQGGQQVNLGAISLQGNVVKIAIPGLGANFDGKFEPDGNAIPGAVVQGTNTMPLSLKRATAQTAWEIPPPPAPPKALPEGTKLEFEVATIKPTPEGVEGRGLNVNGSEFRGRNNTLAQLMTVAFNVNLKQISGLPGWAETDHYDILAPLPPGGAPNDTQLRTLMQNLLRDRFGLVFHKEKREMSVYVIGVGKAGPAGIKLVKNESQGTLPGFGMQGLGRLRARNATLADIAFYLQFRVMDRPVLDQSGVSGRFDITLDWTPDEFQFADAPAAQRAQIPRGPDAPPDLLTAIQEQLGLKLEATRAPTDVMVIDKVSKPSEN